MTLNNANLKYNKIKKIKFINPGTPKGSYMTPPKNDFWLKIYTLGVVVDPPPSKTIFILKFLPKLLFLTSPAKQDIFFEIFDFKN